MKFIKKFKFIIAVLLIILVSTTLEFFLSNTDYLTIKNKGIYDLNIEKISEEIVGDSHNYIYKINSNGKYIDDLQIKINTNATKIKLKIANKYDKNNDSTDYNEYNLNNKLNYISIGQNKKNMYLTFTIKQNKDLKLNSVKINNTLEFNIIRYILIILSLIFIVKVLYILKTKKEVNLNNVFIELMLTFGLILSISNPIFGTWDEKEHFIRAYTLSQGNPIIQYKEKNSYPKKIKEFFEVEAMYMQIGSRNFVNKISYLNNELSGKYEDKYFSSTANTYLFVPYIFSALGIFIAKIFCGSFLFQFYLGRIFNLLIYTFIGYLALKKQKDGSFKNLIFLTLLLPVCIFQAGTYSADVLTNSFAILALSYALNMKFNEKKVTKKDLFIFLIACSITTIGKIAYFPIFLLIFLLPNKNFDNKKLAIIVKVLSVIIGLILFVFGYLYASKAGLVQWSSNGQDSSAQIHFILNNPFKFIYIFFHSINGIIIGQFTMLDCLAYNGTIGGICLILIFVAYIYYALTNCNQLLQIKDKIVLLLISCMCYGAIFSSLYITFTKVGAEMVDGMQGRYLIPFIIMPMLIFNKKNCIKDDYKKSKLSLFVIVLILCVMSVVQIICSNYM